MLQLQSMVEVPERVDRYPTSYQQSMQPMMQRQDSYSYQSPNMSSVPNTYSLPNRRYDYSYNTPSPAIGSHTPTTPAGEEVNKLSLPSISRLLEISDAKQGEQQPVVQHSQQPQPQIPSHHSTPVIPSGEYAESVGYAPSTSSGRISMPSTPPLIPDGPMEGNQSPPAVSTHSMPTHQTYYLSNSATDPHNPKRLSITSQPTTIHSYPTPTYTPTTTYSPFVPSPTVLQTPFYSEPAPLYSSQRPLPSNYPPALPLAPPPTLLQHHHYISASSASTFPASQDRYVCPTCNKAFSRPSSLRIHSHSHTGEKPFKCSHAGCGKAFSVRSNMKRHERGCHAAANNAPSS